MTDGRILDPARGFVCYLGGLAFAVAVTEGLLHGIRLAMPAGFRVPYYLILALFFLYPLALSPLLDRPRSEALAWGLFGFPAAAGLVFLTLLPAIRRGPAYIRDNGSPWRSLYPSGPVRVPRVLPSRGAPFLLCWSMHLLDGADSQRLIFGEYFLVPFGFAVAVLLLEIGLISNHRGAIATALAVPVGLVGLAMIGHRADAPVPVVCANVRLPARRRPAIYHAGRDGGYLRIRTSAPCPFRRRGMSGLHCRSGGRRPGHAHNRRPSPAPAGADPAGRGSAAGARAASRLGHPLFARHVGSGRRSGARRAVGEHRSRSLRGPLASPGVARGVGRWRGV